MLAVDLKLGFPRPTVSRETTDRSTEVRGGPRAGPPATRWRTHHLAVGVALLAAASPFLIARIREQLGEHAAAEAAFRTRLRQNPADPFLLLHLGAVRAKQGDSREARELLRTYDELAWTHPRDRTDYTAASHALMNELAR